jgi:hypothetical protein
MRKVATFKVRYLDNGHLSIPEEVASSLLLKRGEEVRVMIEKEQFDRDGFLGLLVYGKLRVRRRLKSFGES